MADVTEIKKLEKGLSHVGLAVKRDIGQKSVCEMEKNGVNGVGSSKCGEISVLVKTEDEKRKIDTKTETIACCKKLTKKIPFNQTADYEREEGELDSESEDDKEQATLVANETKKIIELISPCFEDIIEFNVSQEDLELIGANEDFIYGDYEEGEVISIKSERILELKDESVVNDDDDDDEDVKKEDIREALIEKVVKETIETDKKKNSEANESNETFGNTENPEDGEIQSPHANDNDSMVVSVGSKCSSMFDVEMLSIGGESTGELKNKEEALHPGDRVKDRNTVVESLGIGANVVIKTADTNNDGNEKSKNALDCEGINGNQTKSDFFSMNSYEINMANTEDAEMISAKSLPFSMEVDVIDSADSTTSKSKLHCNIESEDCEASKKVGNVDKLKSSKMTDESGKEAFKNISKPGRIKTTKYRKQLEKDKHDNGIFDQIRPDNVVNSSKQMKDSKKIYENVNEMLLSGNNEDADMASAKSLPICMEVDVVDLSAIDKPTKVSKKAKCTETETNKSSSEFFPSSQCIESTEKDRSHLSSTKLPSRPSHKVRSVKNVDNKERSQSKNSKTRDNMQPQSSQLMNPCQSNRATPLNFQPCCSFMAQSSIPKNSNHLEDNRGHLRRHGNECCNSSFRSKKKDDCRHISEITEMTASSGDFEDADMISAKSLPIYMEVDIVDSSTIQNSTNTEVVKSSVADKVNRNQKLNNVDKVIESNQDNKNQKATTTIKIGQSSGSNQRNTKNLNDVKCPSGEAPRDSKPKGRTVTSHSTDGKLPSNSSPILSRDKTDQNVTEPLPVYGPEWLFPSPKRIALPESERSNSSPSPRLYRKERALKSFINKERLQSRRLKPYDKPSPQFQLPFQSNSGPPIRPTVPLILQPYCPYTMHARNLPNKVTLYDERGRLRRNGADICDCGSEYCEGCWYNCFECGSKKCGFSCRRKR